MFIYAFLALTLSHIEVNLPWVTPEQLILLEDYQLVISSSQYDGHSARRLSRASGLWALHRWPIKTHTILSANFSWTYFGMTEQYIDRDNQR